MRITDALLGEHGALYAQLDHLAATVLDDDLQALQQRGALLAAALASHAHLEDDVLFDPMEARTGEAGVLDVMREEHRDIEAALNELQLVLDLGSARALLQDLILAVREHFEKEECVAFPLAESVLGHEELETLGLEWARARGVRLTSPGSGYAPAFSPD